MRSRPRTKHSGANDSNIISLDCVNRGALQHAWKRGFLPYRGVTLGPEVSTQLFAGFSKNHDALPLPSCRLVFQYEDVIRKQVTLLFLPFNRLYAVSCIVVRICTMVQSCLQPKRTKTTAVGVIQSLP